jgi:hypothetical protein
MLNISQPYRPPRPVTGIALLYCLDNVRSSTSHNPISLQGLLEGQLYFLYSSVRPKDGMHPLPPVLFVLPLDTFGYSQPLPRERSGDHCRRGVVLHRYVGVERGNRMLPRLTAEG